MSLTTIQALRVAWEAALDRVSQDESALRQARRNLEQSLAYARSCGASVRVVCDRQLSQAAEYVEGCCSDVGHGGADCQAQEWRKAIDEEYGP